MITDTALIEKREELKRRLAAGEYKTLVDVFLSLTNHMLQKITRQSTPLPIWVVTILWSLITTFIFFLSIVIAGDLTTLSNISRVIGYEYVPTVLLVAVYVVFPIAASIAMNHYIGKIFVFWRNDILDATQSSESLAGIDDWLAKVCDRRLHLFVTVVGGGLFVYIVFVNYFTQLLGSFVGYGYIFGTIIPCMFIASFIYQLIMALMLSVRVRHYDLKLFTADPGSSELISRLSREIGSFIYIVAIYTAFFTLTTAQTGQLRTLRTGFVFLFLFIFCWLPLVAIFVSNQTSLSNMIRRTKWKTLNEIQAKVEKLQAAENFEEKETMETIKRLMDYHDRVKATRDSALDFRTYLGFFNSLLLPLLAFILGNLDLALKLFGIKP